MITSVTNTPIINNIHAGNKTQKQLPVQKADAISFSGLHISKTTNKAEIKELIDLLYNSYKHSMAQGTPVKQNWFQRICDQINEFIGKKLTFLSTKLDDSVVGVIKDSKNKIQGGYSMLLDKEDFSAVMNFVTLSPKLKNTKAGKDALFQMCEDIYTHAKKNDISEIIWTKETNNKSAQKLFERLNAYDKYGGLIFKEQESVVFVDDIPKILRDLANKYNANINI